MNDLIGIYKFDVQLTKYNGKKNTFCIGFFTGNPKFSSVNFLEDIIGINFNFKLKSSLGKIREGCIISC